MKTLLPGLLCLLAACQGPSNRQASNGPASAGDSITRDSSIATHSAATAALPPDTTTISGGWYLQPVLPSDTATGKRPFIVFEPGKSRFHGNTGCNNMNGKFWFSDKDSSLTFDDKIMTTRMACPGYNEGNFLKSLLHTAHYRLDHGSLILLSDDNAELSRWKRKMETPAKEIKT